MRTESGEILGRLVKLERSLKVWKALSIFSSLIVIALVSMGLKPPETRILEAERLILRDTKGQIRVIIGGFDTKEDVKAFRDSSEHIFGMEDWNQYIPGYYGLRVFSEKGSERINLSSNEETSQIKLRQGWDKNNYLMLAVDKFHASIMGMAESDKEESDLNKRVELIEKWTKKYRNAKTTDERERLLKDTVEEDSYFALSSFGKTKKRAGGVSLIMKNEVNTFEKGKGWGDVALGEIFGSILGRDSQIDLRDFDEHSRATLGVTSLKTSTGIVENRPPSSLVLFDIEGNVIYKLPK